MKKTTVDVQYGSHEKGNLWTLANVEYELPETMDEAQTWLTPEKCLRAVTTLHTIRLQDMCRRLHAGSKNLAPKRDADIREAAKSFRLFEKVMVAATPRPMTAAELKAHLLTMEPEARAAYLEELMAE